jgi:hypothetical protein
MCVLAACATETASCVFPLPAGPSRSKGFWSFAARKTTLVITESMKYPVAASLVERSWSESNIAVPPEFGRPWNCIQHLSTTPFTEELPKVVIDMEPKDCG